MSNFKNLLLDLLNEYGKTIKDLEENGVLGKNTFYIFDDGDPSLQTLVKLANYFEISIDYMLDRSESNNFKKLKINFSKNLDKLLAENKVSILKFCKDLKISRSNFYRWRNGTLPTLSKLILIADYFSISIDELVG